jgi:hypothetical protein
VAIKELRELLRRPLLVLTLVLGPLAIMLLFGVGTDNVVSPPRAIVVVPPGRDLPRLVLEHRREFEQFLQVQEYTTDEEYARGQLAKSLIDAVVIVPPAAYQTIAGGEQARILVLYNEIDPARRYQTAEDFIAALEQARRAPTRQIVMEPVPVEPLVDEDSTRWWLWALAALVIAALLIGGYFLLAGKKVTVPNLVLAPGVGELLGGERPNGFQQAIARAGSEVVGDHQRLVDEMGHPGRNVLGGHRLVGAHPSRSVQGEPPGEHRQCRQQPSLQRSQQVVAPRDRGS